MMAVLGIWCSAYADELLDKIVCFEEGSSNFDIESGNRLINGNEAAYSLGYDKVKLEKLILEGASIPDNTGLVYDPAIGGGSICVSLTPQEAIPASGVVAPFDPPPPEPAQQQ